MPDCDCIESGDSTNSSAVRLDEIVAVTFRTRFACPHSEQKSRIGANRLCNAHSIAGRVSDDYVTHIAPSHSSVKYLFCQLKEAFADAVPEHHPSSILFDRRARVRILPAVARDGGRRPQFLRAVSRSTTSTSALHRCRCGTVMPSRHKRHCWVPARHSRVARVSLRAAGVPSWHAGRLTPSTTVVRRVSSLSRRRLLRIATPGQGTGSISLIEGVWACFALMDL